MVAAAGAGEGGHEGFGGDFGGGEVGGGVVTIERERERVVLLSGHVVVHCSLAVPDWDGGSGSLGTGRCGVRFRWRYFGFSCATQYCFANWERRILYVFRSLPCLLCSLKTHRLFVSPDSFVELCMMLPCRLAAVLACYLCVSSW